MSKIRSGKHQFSPTIGGALPGNSCVIAGYSNEDIPGFDNDPLYRIDEIIKIVPVAVKSDNYSFLLNFR